MVMQGWGCGDGQTRSKSLCVCVCGFVFGGGAPCFLHPASEQRRRGEAGRASQRGRRGSCMLSSGRAPSLAFAAFLHPPLASAPITNPDKANEPQNMLWQHVCPLGEPPRLESCSRLPLHLHPLLHRHGFVDLESRSWHAEGMPHAVELFMMERAPNGGAAAGPDSGAGGTA